MHKENVSLAQMMPMTILRQYVDLESDALARKPLDTLLDLFKYNSHIEHSKLLILQVPLVVLVLNSPIILK